MSNQQQFISRNADTGEIESRDASSSAEVAREPQQPAGVGFKSQVRGQKLSVNIASGKVTESSTQSMGINLADMVSEAAAADPGSVAATVQSPLGRPIVNRGIEETDIVTVNGLQMQVAQAMSLGLLAVDMQTNNNIIDNFSEEEALAYAERNNNQQEPEELYEVLSDETLNDMRMATRGFDEVVATQRVMQALDGTIDPEQFQRECERSGIDPQMAAAFMDRTVNGVAGDLCSQLGLDVETDEDVIESWAALSTGLRESNPKQYQDAIRHLVMVGDAKPLLEVLRVYHNQHGVLGDIPEDMESKTVNGEKLVKVVGSDGAEMWARPAVARRLGII